MTCYSENNCFIHYTLLALLFNLFLEFFYVFFSVLFLYAFHIMRSKHQDNVQTKTKTTNAEKDEHRASTTEHEHSNTKKTKSTSTTNSQAHGQRRTHEHEHVTKKGEWRGWDKEEQEFLPPKKWRPKNEAPLLLL